MDELATRLQPIVAAHQRFDVTARGVGGFPTDRRAQVLWAGIEGDDAPRLVALQAALGRELSASGIVVEDRFHPHLTLARVRRPLRGAARPLIDRWYADWREARFGDFRVEAVQLMRSELGSGPPRYTRLASFALK